MTNDINTTGKLTSDAIKELKLATEKVSTEATKTPLEVAKDQLSVLDNMDNTLQRIAMSGAFGMSINKDTGKDTGGGMELANTIGKYAKESGVETLINSVKGEMSSFNTTLIDFYGSGLTLVSGMLATLNTNIATYITETKNAMDFAMSVIATRTPDTSAPTTTGYDVYLPPGSSKYVSTGFGELIKLDKMDASLNLPESDMKNLFDYANLGEKMAKTKPFQLTNPEKMNTINEYVEQKIITESISKKEVTVGGETSVKINIDSNLIAALA